MADGTAYHTSGGLTIQDLTGDRVDLAHFEAHLPTDMRFLSFWGPVDYSQMYLPAFRKRVQIETLPGWTVLAR